MKIRTKCEKSRVEKNAQLEGEMCVFKHFITKLGQEVCGLPSSGDGWIDCSLNESL